MGQLDFAKAALRWFAGAALFILFQLVWSPVGSVSQAQAQTSCTDTSNNGLGTLAIQGNLATGLCTFGGVPASGFTIGNISNPGGPNFNVSFTGRDAGAESPTSLICTGTFATNNGSTITLNDGDSCAVNATFDINGTILTLTGNIARATNTVTTTGFVVSGGAFGPFPSTGPTAQDKSNIVAGLQSAFNSATPGLLENLNGNGGAGAGGNGVSFAPTGLGFSQGAFDAANPMDREFGAAFAPQGYFDGGQTHRAGNGFNFSVDLNRLANAGNESRHDTGELGYGTGGAKYGTQRPQSRVTSFVTGKYTDFNDGETNADRDGHLWTVTSGLGYRVNANTTVGVLSRYRSGEVDSNALNATLDSDFYGGGAFLTTKLGGGLKVALAGLYEFGDNDIRIGTATGSFDSEHVTLEGRIDKRIERGRFWIEPGVGIRYIDTDQDNYTDSAGTLVTNQGLTLGRLTYGPTIGTTIHRGNAAWQPFAKINGLWDFENDGAFATSTAGTFSSADSAINLGGGIEVTYASGMSLRLAGDWYGYDTDLEVWSISGGFGAPLSALGLASAGLVSLDFASNLDDTQGMARVKIPLGHAR